MKRPEVDGKFLVLDGEKFFVKGVTYGAFPPNSQGHQFPEDRQIKQDFRLMREAGINTFLTYTVPPVSVLDRAAEHGLRVIVNTPWMGYQCFLEERRTREQIRREVRNMVASCRRHPAVLMYAVSKELPPPIVRWHGARRVEAFLRELYHVAKDEDPGSLVTYTNYPTTEYLELPFVDVFTFNVYLHERSQFCPYLAHLQHLAGELPMVLSEFGMCSFRHGREGQAQFLDWQIEEIFDHGMAGAVIFGWTDPFFQDNVLIEDWGFGLVDKDRRPKPSYEVVRRRFTGATPFPANRTWPRISVVVAAHNAARTLDDCLGSLTRLRYPDYEVIVVDDGSTDGTGDIAAQYPFLTVTTDNQGVSAARNEGLRVATGSIVAYIDSDAKADPDWLSYIATTYLTSDVSGAGGPNLVPPEDGWIAKCVYRAPGGPTQVMFDDTYAEHIPGCNMTFLKSALEDVGGFDPIYTAAGDDVDICWRLLERGYKIGFNPAAVVWHHRRPSIQGYWKQQVGYGLSECLLEGKHPNKFNPWGHTFWAGRIYGPYPFFRLFGKPVIYHGLWGSAGFQPMYDPGGGGVLSFLPRAMEWHFALLALSALGFLYPWMFALVALGLVYTAGYCMVCASKANLDVLEAAHGPSTPLRRLKWRATIAWLNFLEPIARDWGRLKGGLAPWRTVHAPNRPVERASRFWQRLHPFQRSIGWRYRGNMGLEKNAFLDRMTRRLTAMGCAVGWNPNSETWDLKVRRGTLGEATLSLVIEHHGGVKRLARVQTATRPPRVLYWLYSILAGVTGLTAAGSGSAVALGVLALVFLILWLVPIREANRLEAAIRFVADEVAAKLQEPHTRKLVQKTRTTPPPLARTARAGD
jgi:glycosyltransferase involved in cell wall biosynthesis